MNNFPQDDIPYLDEDWDDRLWEDDNEPMLNGEDRFGAPRQDTSRFNGEWCMSTPGEDSLLALLVSTLGEQARLSGPEVQRFLLPLRAGRELMEDPSNGVSEAAALAWIGEQLLMDASPGLQLIGQDYMEQARQMNIQRPLH